MILRRLFLGIVLIWAAMPSIVMADRPSDSQGYKTIGELFAAYRKERDVTHRNHCSYSEPGAA